MYYHALDTPALLVDLDRMEANSRRMADFASSQNVALRPHTKTHKCPEIAQMQIQHGAQGIACAKTAEAEVMIAAGINDVLIANEIIGEQKFQKLSKLMDSARVCIAVDSTFGVSSLARFMKAAGKRIDVVIEVNCGHNRCGVLPGEPTLALATTICSLDNLHLRGLMSHGGHIYDAQSPAECREIARKEVQLLTRSAELLQEHAIAVPTVSVGSSPGAYHYCHQPGVTELRPGNYIFYDLTQVGLHACQLQDCALSVLATVTSIPAPDRVIIDTGKKALTSDALTTSPGSFGLIPEKNCAISRMSEEHGIIHTDAPFAFGEKIRIIPNHACVVVNMFDEMYGLRNGEVERIFQIAARGKMS